MKTQSSVKTFGNIREALYMENNQRCPDCNCVNPTTEHLLKEYRDLLKHGFNSVFGYNARKVLNEVVDLLHSRGVFAYEDIFGLREVKKWKQSR